MSATHRKIALGFLAAAPADRREYLADIYERCRVGLEGRSDWTPDERLTALLGLAKAVTAALRTRAMTAGEAAEWKQYDARVIAAVQIGLVALPAE
jgi:hypothetical protein